MTARLPAVVLGGSGYVAGELLRLLAAHPHFTVAGVMSDSRPGEPIAQSFAHLATAYPEQRFCAQRDVEELIARERRLALFCAAPHGTAAPLLDTLLATSERHFGEQAVAAGEALRIVDISADFRYRNAEAYQATYGHAHAAPSRLAAFSCAVPEHLSRPDSAHIAHPGCFATAILLACVPLLALELVEPELFVAAITGSTGSGRKPVEGTHHPLRHSDLYSYSVLAHRHVPEIIACARAASGVEAQLAFVPHSGPFARGIHATVQARLRRSHDTAHVLGALRDYYAGAPFIQVRASAPRVKEVVASNYAQLSAVSDGRTVAAFCTIDNLTKGAAGGAVQWMNRLYGLPQTAGLTAPAAGWT